jgi:hypothetical protein
MYYLLHLVNFFFHAAGEFSFCRRVIIMLSAAIRQFLFIGCSATGGGV